MCKAQLVFQRADMVVTDGRRSSSSDCRTVLKHSFYCFLLVRSLLCVRKWGFPEFTSVILPFDISDADAFHWGNLSCLCMWAVPGVQGQLLQFHAGLRGRFWTSGLHRKGEWLLSAPSKEHLELPGVRFPCPCSAGQYLQLSQDV